MDEVLLKRFNKPDEVRTFAKGKFEVIRMKGFVVGKATYEPGWKWSDNVGTSLGQRSCPVEHVGMVVEGRAAVAMDDGTTIEMGPGDFFHIPAGHDSWVVGDRAYVSLHFMGADEYATK